MPNIAQLQSGSPEKPLTDKQRRFVEEYMVDLNATAAAVRAGYSRKTSGLYTTLMGLPHVKAAIEQGLAEKRGRAAWLADRVVEELARVAFANVQDFVRAGADGAPVVDVWSCERAAAAAVARVSLEYVAPGGEDSPPPSSDRRARDDTSPKGGGARGRARWPVKRVSVSLADKTSALKALVKVLGVEAAFARERLAARPGVTGLPRHLRRPPLAEPVTIGLVKGTDG